MKFSDEFFNKIEKKTNVNKDTILSLAKKIQSQNMQDDNNLRDLIKDISSITGKSISKEKEDKIINTIKNNKIPNDFSKYVK